MTMQGTPGPWRVNPDDPEFREIETDDEGRCTIAYVECDNCDDPKQVAADAHLIAAAPDLLEAARGFVSLYPGHKADDCTPPGCAVCRCRAAIAKAEGR